MTISLQNDNNNHAPVLTQSSYAGSISEDATDGVTVFEVRATDDDFILLPTAGTISEYELTGDPEVLRYFRTEVVRIESDGVNVGAVVLK